MKISNNLVKLTALSAMLSGISGCTRKPFKEIPKARTPETILVKLDSLSTASCKVLKDTAYKFFGKDTVLLNPDFVSSPDIFMRRVDLKAKQNSGRSIIGTYTVSVPVYNGKSVSQVSQIRHKYADNYLRPKAVIRESRLFTTNSKDLYVPVEFYGIPNPHIKSKICHQK